MRKLLLLKIQLKTPTLQPAWMLPRRASIICYFCVNLFFFVIPAKMGIHLELKIAMLTPLTPSFTYCPNIAFFNDASTG